MEKKLKFREMVTCRGSNVLIGKSALQNEELVKEFIGKENIILHTEKPGSPFCVIENLKPLKKEIKETAIVCARYSQDYRDNKSDVEVHVFFGKDVYKRKGMKLGTFGVKKFELVKVKKKEVERILGKATKK
jgi:predicted ribosome quality control (RQC) complex YloA/Tae2 family protein